jgi:hypothetical protein
MMRQQTPSPVHRHMNALLLLDDGWTAECIAAVLFIDADTVRQHRRLYQTAGVTGIGPVLMNPITLSMPRRWQQRRFASSRRSLAWNCRSLGEAGRALAIATMDRLLFKGNDFIDTDIRPAVARHEASRRQPTETHTRRHRRRNRGEN